jgi:hypothetical protein
VSQTVTENTAPIGGAYGDDSAADITIGDYTTTCSGDFSGLIDDVRIYNRALSADGIKQLYKIGGTFKVNTSINNNRDSLEKGLVGWWTFDRKDMSGVQAYDKSGNGNRGILTNGPVRTISKIGQGMEFDGISSYISLPNTSLLNITSNITMAAWVKTTQANNEHIIGGYGLVAGFPGYGFGVGSCANDGKPCYWSGTQGAWVSANSTVNDG